jgi:hypothetical protein
MNDLFEYDIKRVARTLVTHSQLFHCSLEKAWEDHISFSIKDFTTFEEVEAYIKNEGI